MRGEPRNSQNAMDAVFLIEPKVWRGSHFTNVQAKKDENTTLRAMYVVAQTAST